MKTTTKVFNTSVVVDRAGNTIQFGHHAPELIAGAWPEQYAQCCVCGTPVDDKTLAWSAWQHVKPYCSPKCHHVAELKRYACCDKATARMCVCYFSTECPVHGTRCVGTHD